MSGSCYEEAFPKDGFSRSAACPSCEAADLAAREPRADAVSNCESVPENARRCLELQELGLRGLEQSPRSAGKASCETGAAWCLGEHA